MVQDHGKEKAVALRGFDAVVTLTRQSATDILKVMWPNAEEASPAEFAKAVGLCVDYGLDPRLNELFLIPFKKKDKDGKVIGTTYETVRGIKATRKVALRKHKYSYVDFTPRLMTEDEEKKVFKDVSPDEVRYITKLKDLETGAEAPGYGVWPKYKVVNGKRYRNNPKGKDKGNTMENMSAIHSERAALDRLYPADMPSSRIPVVDESFIDVDYSLLKSEDEDIEELEEQAEEEQPGTNKITAIRLPEGDGEVGAKTAAHQGEGGKTESTSSPSPKGRGKTPTQVEGEGFNIDLDWLNMTLKQIRWDEDTAKTWIISSLKVGAQGKLTDVLARLTREQAERFTKELNDRAARVQPGLF